MASIHKNLVFDHFYVSLNGEEFESLKEIMLRFSCASHSVVKSDGDSWEGVYIHTRGRNYLEFLNDRRVNGMGICQTSFSLLFQDARNIVHDFPDLPWKTFDRTIRGQKWYTALSLEEYTDLQTPFNTWVMHTYQSDSEGVFPMPRFEIGSQLSLEVSGNPGLIDKIKKNTQWMNADISFSDALISVRLQTYYSERFEIQIALDHSEPGFKFKKSTLKLADGFEMPDFENRHFRFFREGEFHILQRK